MWRLFALFGAAAASISLYAINDGGAYVGDWRDWTPLNTNSTWNGAPRRDIVNGTRLRVGGRGLAALGMRVARVWSLRLVGASVKPEWAAAYPHVERNTSEADLLRRTYDEVGFSVANRAFALEYDLHFVRERALAVDVGATLLLRVAGNDSELGGVAYAVAFGADASFAQGALVFSDATPDVAACLGGTPHALVCPSIVRTPGAPVLTWRAHNATHDISARVRVRAALSTEREHAAVSGAVYVDGVLVGERERLPGTVLTLPADVWTTEAGRTDVANDPAFGIVVTTHDGLDTELARVRFGHYDALALATHAYEARRAPDELVVFPPAPSVDTTTAAATTTTTAVATTAATTATTAAATTVAATTAAATSTATSTTLDRATTDETSSRDATSAPRTTAPPDAHRDGVPSAAIVGVAIASTALCACVIGYTQWSLVVVRVRALHQRQQRQLRRRRDARASETIYSHYAVAQPPGYAAPTFTRSAASEP